MKQAFQTLMIGAVLSVVGGISSSVARDFTDWSDAEICGRASSDGYWSTRPFLSAHVEEAKRRGLVCGVKELLKKEALRKERLRKLEEEEKRKTAERRIFNACMLKNVKPNSNSAHIRIVMNYCEDLASK